MIIWLSANRWDNWNFQYCRQLPLYSQTLPNNCRSILARFSGVAECRRRWAVRGECFKLLKTFAAYSGNCRPSSLTAAYCKSILSMLQDYRAGISRVPHNSQLYAKYCIDVVRNTRGKTTIAVAWEAAGITAWSVEMAQRRRLELRRRAKMAGRRHFHLMHSGGTAGGSTGGRAPHN